MPGKPWTSLYSTLLLAATTVAVAEPPDDLAERIHTSHAALARLEIEYAQLRRQDRLSSVERSDYAAYLDGLRAQIRTDCLQLRRQQAGILPPGLPCPAQPFVMQPPLLPDQTPTEQLAQLDAELNASLGDFDQMLLREQDRVKQETPRTRDPDGGGGGGDADAGYGESGADDGEGGQAETTGTPMETTGEGGNRPPTGSGAGGPQRPAAGGQPDDLPDGSDDDLVARQLREAAEKEQDPELKKRLWEEYRRYKQGR